MNTKRKWRKWANLWSQEPAENSRCHQSTNPRLQTMLWRWTMWLDGIGQRSLARSKTDTRDGWKKPSRSWREREPPWTETRGDIFFHMFMMNCYLKNPQRGEKQLATPKLPLPEVQLVLVVAVSSSVDKEDRRPWNVHSKLNYFWIRNRNFSSYLRQQRSWWIYLIKYI